MRSPLRRLKEWEETTSRGLLLSGCLLTLAGAVIPIWALIDPDRLLDRPKFLLALIVAPFALVAGIRRLRRAADAP